MELIDNVGPLGKRFLSELGINSDNDIPASFFEVIKPYSKNFSEAEQFCLNDYHIAFIGTFKFCMDKVVGTNHTRYAGHTWIDAFIDLDRKDKLLTLYFENPDYYDELKSGNIIDLDLVLKDGEYYIFDKAGGGNNRMILMKLKYLALKEKTLDKEKLDEEFSFCGNIRMSPPEEIAKNIFYFMFPNGGYRESCYQIINKSNDITNPLFQIVTNYPSNPIIIQDSLTYEELSHLEENFVDKNKAK